MEKMNQRTILSIEKLMYWNSIRDLASVFYEKNNHSLLLENVNK